MTTQAAVFCERALLADGWCENVRFSIAPRGKSISIERNIVATFSDQRVRGPVVSALINFNSHAFQRNMAGITEISGLGEDSFWTWRVQMCRLVSILSPGKIKAAASKLYSELRKSCFGRAVEFHDLHHGSCGGCSHSGRKWSRDVVVTGRWVIRDHQHDQHHQIGSAFQHVLRKLA